MPFTKAPAEFRYLGRPNDHSRPTLVVPPDQGEASFGVSTHRE